MNGSTNGNRSDETARGSARAVAGNAADVLHDVTALAELQAKLLAADLKTTGRRTIVPTACLTVAACLLLGLVPIVLFGVGELMLEYTELSLAIALFLASGLALFLAGVFAVVGWLTLKNVFRELESSTTELKQNISWIKQTLKNGGSVQRR